MNNSGRMDKPAKLLQLEQLQDSLLRISNENRGEIGVALIYEDRDTIYINNEAKYPMMSVFKLHQGMATCNYMSANDIPFDSVVKIPRKRLNADTWSPMLQDYKGDSICISYRTLLRYAIEQSDNNASNFLFETILGPQDVYNYITTFIPYNSFQILYTEADMLPDHKRAYDNSTSPLAAASLINRLFTDPLLMGSVTISDKGEICEAGKTSEAMSIVRECLNNCRTGQDRIVSPLLNEIGVTVGHKTGSGFRDNGILAAQNDVAFISLPEGRHYSLAIFVKDYPGSESEASSIIARISAAVYSILK